MLLLWHRRIKSDVFLGMIPSFLFMRAQKDGIQWRRFLGRALATRRRHSHSTYTGQRAPLYAVVLSLCSRKYFFGLFAIINLRLGYLASDSERVRSHMPAKGGGRTSSKSHTFGGQKMFLIFHCCYIICGGN